MNKIAVFLSLLSFTVTGEVRGCCESFRLEPGGMGDFYQVGNSSDKENISLARSEKSSYDMELVVIVICHQGSRLGKYELAGSSSSGKGIYSQTNGENFLFYLVSAPSQT